MRWVPLESNPDLFTSYLGALGLDTSRVAFTDVYGFDDELLQMVPGPVLATVLLYPITDASEAKRKEQAALTVDAPDVVYTRQRIGNACGTIGLMHAVANCKAPIKSDSPLARLFAEMRCKSPDEAAAVLEADASLATAHETAAAGGQTAAPSADDRIDLHFCAFVEHAGRLLELDGRKAGPVDHGAIRTDVLRESARVTQDFMALAPDNPNFSLIALSPV